MLVRIVHSLQQIGGTGPQIQLKCNAIKNVETKADTALTFELRITIISGYAEMYITMTHRTRTSK